MVARGMAKMETDRLEKVRRNSQGISEQSMENHKPQDQDQVDNRLNYPRSPWEYVAIKIYNCTYCIDDAEQTTKVLDWDGLHGSLLCARWVSGKLAILLIWTLSIPCESPYLCPPV